MDNCIFCKIGAGAIQADEVYRDEAVVAFRDLDPKAPTHILVIPVQHVASVAEMGPEAASLGGHLLAVCARVAQENVNGNGYRVVTNVGPEPARASRTCTFTSSAAARSAGRPDNYKSEGLGIGDGMRVRTSAPDPVPHFSSPRS
jgi:histidine triad (HIT) family protein